MMFLKAVSAARRTYPVITDGLKLYLDAYNTRSYSGTGTTWYDLSNSGYNFTNDGGTWAVSGGRRYFELDGVNDRIYGTNTTTLFDYNTVGWTWSLWIYYVTAPAFIDVIINSEYASGKLPYYLDNRNASSGGGGYQTGIYYDAPYFSSQFARYVATVTTATWRQVTATFSYTTSTTGTLKVYLNGTEQATNNATLPSGLTWADHSNSKKPVIGAFLDSGTFSRYNNIRVGEVLNYNRALSGTEISNNYNSTKSNYGL